MFNEEVMALIIIGFLYTAGQDWRRRVERRWLRSPGCGLPGARRWSRSARCRRRSSIWPFFPSQAGRSIECSRNRATTAAACMAWIGPFPPPLTAALSAAAASAQAIRLAGWKPHSTVRNPLLWILHLSYAWIPVRFFLIAAAALKLIVTSIAWSVAFLIYMLVYSPFLFAARVDGRSG
jgi:uncharacterized protein involved in response to NO